MTNRLENWFVANEERFVANGMTRGTMQLLEADSDADSGLEILMDTADKTGRIFLSKAGSLETEICDSVADVTISYEYFEMSESDTPEQFLEDYVFLLGLAGGCSCSGCGN